MTEASDGPFKRKKSIVAVFDKLGVPRPEDS